MMTSVISRIHVYTTNTLMKNTAELIKSQVNRSLNLPVTTHFRSAFSANTAFVISVLGLRTVWPSSRTSLNQWTFPKGFLPYRKQINNEFKMPKATVKLKQVWHVCFKNHCTWDSNISSMQHGWNYSEFLSLHRDCLVVNVQYVQWYITNQQQQLIQFAPFSASHHLHF